jgi:predicted transcriptional regulator
MFEQAHAQGGVLTHADVGAILHLSAPTVGHYVKEWEAEHVGQLVPRRATIHDMGPTLTHKAVIYRRVILEGQSLETAAQATRHSPAAVERYVRDYRRVQTCLHEGLSTMRTAYATGLSPQLVKQYEDLITQEQRKRHCKKEVR